MTSNTPFPADCTREMRPYAGPLHTAPTANGATSTSDSNSTAAAGRSCATSNGTRR